MTHLQNILWFCT